MRFVAAIAGIVVSVLPLIFFWIGAQTFIRPHERALAVGATLETGALLLMSIALFFTPSVQRLQGILLITTIGTVAIILGVYGQLR
jgi:uncharacterized membrane protein